jgi:ABC-2 type transport system ATP-binding protein
MRDPRPAGVRIQDLAKRYGRVEAVRGVGLEAGAGEVLGILGPNGAGKTSVLECLLGLRRPDSGSIEVGGIDAVAHPARARAGMGAQLQSAFLPDKITAREAVALFGSFYEDAVPAGALLARFGLGEKAGAPFDSLSGGQRQRLFLALALVNNPSVVVLDEPTAGLDPRSRQELHALIRGMRASGRTVLLSTHLVEDAQALCDTVAVLREGRVVATGSPADLVARATPTTSVAVRLERPLDLAEASRLPAVVSSRADGDTWRLGTRDPAATITGLMRLLDASGTKMLDLQVHSTSLEDAYMELTGASGAPEGAP